MSTLPDCRYLDTADARLCYRDQGAGPAVVLIHGWLLDSTLWTAQAAAWSTRFRVLRMDRRGCGASTGTPSLADDVRDVALLLDRLGIVRAAVLGMSQGARIALQIAAATPERVACLVLDGTPALDGLPGEWRQEAPVDAYRELLLRDGVTALRHQLAAHPLLQLRTHDPDARRALDAMLARYDGADLLAPPGPAVQIPVERLARLDMPVLLLNGAHDSGQRLAVGAALAGLIPGAERRLVPSAGHLACLDDRETYNAICLEFLTRNLHRWA